MQREKEAVQERMAELERQMVAAQRQNREAEKRMAAEKQQQKHAQRTECPMCLEELRDCPTIKALVPCGHSLCGDCADAHVAGRGKCPVCVTAVVDCMRVYL